MSTLVYILNELKQLIQNILQELLLSISCHDCNQKKGTLTAEEFIEQTLTPQKLRQISKTKQLLKYMAYMNATRWVLYNTIKGTYDSVRLTYGSITKRNRINAGIPKAHHIDAKCNTGFSTVPSFDEQLLKLKCVDTIVNCIVQRLVKVMFVELRPYQNLSIVFNFLCIQMHI